MTARPAIRLPLGFALVLLTLVACSGGDVVVNVDLQSFVTESGTLDDPSTAYASPVLPVPVLLDGLPLVEPSSVNLVDAVGDLTVVREVRLGYALEAVNRKGEGGATVRVRLAGRRDQLALASSVVDSVRLDLDPATTTPVRGSFDLDPDEVELFNGDELWISLDAAIFLGAGAAGDSLAGTLWVRDLDARVVADEDLF